MKSWLSETLAGTVATPAAFVVPFLLGAAGISAATVGVFGFWVASTALSLGLAWGASKLAQVLLGDNGSAEQQQGSQINLRTESDHPRMVPIGVVADGGSLTYWQFSDNNQTLQMVIDLGDVPCGNILGIIVDGEAKTLNPDGTVEGYDGKLHITYHNGNWNQAADSSLIARAVGGAWTSTDIKAGTCYVVVKLIYDTDKFPGGSPPRMTFIFQGAKLYDWRKDTTVGGSGAHRWNDWTTWEYTDNPIVAAYNWERGFWYNNQHLYGMKTPSYLFDLSSYTAAANACDESVLKKDTTTEKRYTCNCSLNTSDTNRANFEKILRSCGGFRVNSGGIRKIGVAVAGTVVRAVVDKSDFIATEPFTYTSKLSGDNLINAVFGKFVDPTSGYQISSAPPRISLVDEATDGERKAVNITYDSVISQTQAQRLMEISRRLGRYQGIGKVRLRGHCSGLEPGDWITMTVESRGWTNKVFRVVSVEVHEDFQITIEFREIGANAFSYTASTDELDLTNPAVVTAGNPTADTITGLALNTILVSLSGSDQQRPGIMASWTPITDRTVTAIDFAYRIVGSSGDGLVKTSYEPLTNTFAWVDGILGGASYQVRVRLISMPARDNGWTPWYNVSTVTDAVVVDTAAFALSVPPGSITPEQLSAQTRFELALVTATDQVFGSMTSKLDDLFYEVQEAARLAGEALARSHVVDTETKEVIVKTVQARIEDVSASVEVVTAAYVTADAALANQITTVSASLGALTSTVTNIQSAYVTADTAITNSITSLSTTVGGHTTSITNLLSSVDGISAQWAIGINTNNQVTGLVSLGSSGSVSTFTVVASIFNVAIPSVTGGSPVPVFAIANVNGSPKLAIRADMYSDGVIAARSLSVTSLSAISADLGTVIAGLIRDSANTYQFQVSNGWIGHTDGSTYFDIKNKKFRIG